MCAHHATATQFDVSKTVEVTGTVSRLDWANPHVHVTVDVKTGATTQRWNIELSSPGGTIVAGLSKDLLKPGTTVTIAGYPARTSLGLCAKQLTLADGSTTTFVVGL